MLGASISWKRERHKKHAGLRTHVLVSLAASHFALLARNLTEFDTGGEGALRVDPLRLIEAVTSGVAFLAAGTIITARGRVHGLTTGAGMWLAGAVGLACSVGSLPLAILATGMSLIVLGLLSAFTHRDPP